LPAATPAPPAPEVSGIVAPPPPSPAFSDRIFGVAPDEAPRAPLPVPAAEPPAPPAHDHPPAGRAPAPLTGFVPPAPPAEEGVVVLGYRCSRSHLNDPRVSFCAHCGIRMDQLTGVLVRGRRPPLGLVVLDTGSTFVLDDDYLLGRDPENDPEVREGRLRPLRLDDTSGTMSRAHLEIRLQGWDVAVVDRGSANGTYVAAPVRVLATHTGQLGEFPPTRKAIVVQAIFYCELDEDRTRLLRVRAFFDLYDAAMQLGVLPKPGSTGARALMMLRGFGLRG